VLALDPDLIGRHARGGPVAAGTFATAADATAFYDGLANLALPAVESVCVANEVPLDREPAGMTHARRRRSPSAGTITWLVSTSWSSAGAGVA
jgi:hypothetical protein